MRPARAAAALCLVFLAACPTDEATAPKEPKAPEPPTIGAATPGNASAKIAFTAPTDTGTASISEYIATCTSGATQLTGSGIASPVTVSGMINGTTYTCTVKAKNSVGASAESGTVTVTPVTVPGAPAIGSVVAGIAQLSVSFTAGSDGGSPITEFVATCTPTGGSGVNGSGTASPITVSGLANGTTYGCRVAGKNAIGTGALSATANGSTASAPGAPSIGAATVGNAQLSIAFNAPSNTGGSPITGYTATCTPSGGSAVTAEGTSSPIIVSGLTNGTAYTCSIVAKNAVGSSSSSSNATGTPATVPDAPTLGTVTAGNGNASVAFTASASNGGSAITSYTATCSVTGGVARTATSTTSPITVPNLTNGTTYDCSVAASNARGTSAASASATVTPAGPPPAPTIGTGTAGNGSATIAFTPPASNGGSAIINYTATCVVSTNTYSASGTSSPITIPGLTNGTAYSCSVKATSALGAGTASGTVSVTPRTVPSAPTIGAVTSGDAAAIVSFTAGSNGGSTITGYTASCAPSAGGTAKTATGTSSPVTVPQLTNGTQYTCSVIATNVAGNSPASGTATVIPAAPITTSAVMCPYSYSQLNTVALLQSTVSWTCNTTQRTMTSTQIPDYPAAKLYTGDPNTMTAQADPAMTFSLTPARTGTTTQRGNVIGWAKNGVKFDPATAETCPTQSYCGSGYGTGVSFNVEALGQSLFSAGVDNANAHIQPNGAYHYHGMPNKYLSWLSSSGADTVVTPTVQHYLVGFAVDGFPIYAKYGYADSLDATSLVREMKSSWRKKLTADAGRPSTSTIAMGTFTQDWENVAGLGDLDECNGRFAKTPDFPLGIYQYYITNDFPYIQRCLKGTVPTTGRGGSGSSARIALPFGGRGRGRPPRR